MSGNDPVVTGTIAPAQLVEYPDAYTRLAVPEREVEEHLHPAG